jgi:UDP-glucose 4-epimerase
VGSICAELLVKLGYTVIASDNLSEGHRQAVPPEAVFLHCDLADPQQLDRLFRSHSIHAVMHFAAECLVEKSVKEPSVFYLTNVAYAINLLDAMMRYGVNRLIFSSTAAVYGEPETVPIAEEHRTLPINPYGRSKLLFEQVLEAYRASASLRYISLRYFNAAGASAERGEDHRNETHIIPLLLQVALGQQSRFQVNGNDYLTPDGTCIRDYVHVLDIAEAHVQALKQIDQFSGQTFNVGNSRGYSVLEVVEAVRHVTGKSVATTFGPRRRGDPSVLVASSEKICRDLGWQPEHSNLHTIVETAWAWKQRFPFGYGGTAQDSD